MALGILTQSWLAYNSVCIRDDIVENLEKNSGLLKARNLTVNKICPILTLVVTVTKMWDSISNNEIIVR